MCYPCTLSWPEFGGASSDSYSLLFVFFCWSSNTVCIITLCITCYSLSVLCCVTAAHRVMFTQDAATRDVTWCWDPAGLTSVCHSSVCGGEVGLLPKLSQTFRQSFTCLLLSERQSPRNVYEIIPSGAEKSYSSSVTHSVIVWGNERIKKWGREDAGISTDKWERSLVPVRRPSYSTSSLSKTILRPYELSKRVIDWLICFLFFLSR